MFLSRQKTLIEAQAHKTKLLYFIYLLMLHTPHSLSNIRLEQKDSSNTNTP
jgi:hypothetical protein